MTQLCDNSDGKQARKIGASSPLGMILDHGCDALTTCTIALSVGRIVGLSKFWQAYVLALSAFLFFLANLEQYYTHYLYLPKINAVSEGVWGLSLLCIVTGFVGSDVWTKSPLGVENNKLMLLSFTAIGCWTVYYHSRKILEKTSSAEYGLKVRFSVAFCLVTLLMHLANPRLYEYYYMYVLAFSVSKVTIICQLSHVTAREFQPLRFANIGILGFFILILLLSLFRVDVAAYRSLLFVVAFADFANFTFIVCTRLAKILEIDIFRVAPKSGVQKESGTTGGTSLEAENFKKVTNSSDTIPEESL